MRRTLILIFLCLALLLGLCACGGKNAQPGAADSQHVSAVADEKPLDLADGKSYAEIYMDYLAVYGALLDEVEQRIEIHNGILKASYPDSYYMNSNYLMQVYIPFSTAYPGLVSPLTDESMTDALAALQAAFPDAELTCTAPGRYEAFYTFVDKTSGASVDRKGQCIWERDGAAGSFRVRAFVDDELVEFTEFVPQGDNLYFLYTLTDKALVRYDGERITAIWHAHRISDAPMGSFPGDMRLCSLADVDAFPAGTVETSWITEDADAEYVLVLDNDVMTYSGKISQDLLDQNGNKTGVSWQSIEPITLYK